MLSLTDFAAAFDTVSWLILIIIQNIYNKINKLFVCWSKRAIKKLSQSCVLFIYLFKFLPEWFKRYAVKGNTAEKMVELKS